MSNGLIDVLWITALKEEHEAARDAALESDVTPGRIQEWESKVDCPPYRYLRGEYRDPAGRGMSIVLARPTQMSANPTGTLTAKLIATFKPKYVVMSGVCAGNPDSVAYGDVVVADMVYQYDNGKKTDKGFQADHRQIPTFDAWVHLAQDLKADGLPCHGGATLDDAKVWLLEVLAAGVDPKIHPAFKRFFFDQSRWKQTIDDLQNQKWVALRTKSALKITKAGKQHVVNQKLFSIDSPQTLPFIVHVGPIASGNAVIKDGVTWAWLKDKGVRKVLGLEMEAAAFAEACKTCNVQHWLVAKGVMDYADPNKDDRFKAFSARASAQVLLRFLWQFTYPDGFDSERNAPLAGGPFGTQVLGPNPLLGLKHGKPSVVALSHIESPKTPTSWRLLSMKPHQLVSSIASSFTFPMAMGMSGLLFTAVVVAWWLLFGSAQMSPRLTILGPIQLGSESSPYANDLHAKLPQADHPTSSPTVPPAGRILDSTSAVGLNARFPLTNQEAKELQATSAHHENRKLTTTNSLGMNLVYIPAGMFLMGSSDSSRKIQQRYGNESESKWFDPEHPQHRVTLSKSFYLSDTLVTQAQWRELMGNNPSQFQGDDNRPVENINWLDAVDFCLKLREKEHQNYRLPTEAEWEYACRAGTSTAFNLGNEENALRDAGWSVMNSNTTHPVRQRLANAWGLYDMHGNVWQWCSDWNGDYPSGDVVDPTGPVKGDKRILRGGSFCNGLSACRSAYRHPIPPDWQKPDHGFRVAVDPADNPVDFFFRADSTELQETH